MVLVAGLLSLLGCKVTVIVLSFKIHSGIVHQLGRDCLSLWPWSLTFTV